MGARNGESLRQCMNGWVASTPAAVAHQYLSFATQSWNAPGTQEGESDPRVDLQVVRGGLVGESGEMVDALKKGVRSRCSRWNGADVILEIGDAWYYLTQAIMRYGDVSLRELLTRALGGAVEAGGSSFATAATQLESRLHDPELAITALDEAIHAALAFTVLSIRLDGMGDKAVGLAAMAALAAIERVTQVLGVNFRDIFVFNAAKIIERREAANPDAFSALTNPASTYAPSIEALHS